jgi:class 3 adenylate cyclase
MKNTMAERKRQLAAIMFTDIVGFSAMMQTDEKRAAEVRNRHRQVFRELHDKYGGKILQYYGDGTLSIFDSAAAAVECAVDMQIALRRAPQVPLRIGIHTGDITYDDEGAYGDGMNIAARIEPLCTPGGVFISSKVYDDIKNHPWLKAFSLGFFRLKNIQHEVEIFAVSSHDLPTPRAMSSGLAGAPAPAEDEAPPLAGGRREKTTAAILALILGIFGVHRFYLGQRGKGIAYLVIALLGIVSSMDGDMTPFLPVMAVLAFIDAVLLYFMPQAEFDKKYNPALQAAPARAHAREEVYREEQERAGGNPYKKSGVRKFRAGNFSGALEDFQRALDIAPEDMAIHFNLACCYSRLRDGGQALYHLAKAIEYGFWDYDKIHQHPALAFLRAQPAFDSFVANDYRLTPSLPAPREEDVEEMLDLNSQRPELSVLDQIADLGELMERGVITREEFDEQKRKLLDQ